MTPFVIALGANLADRQAALQGAVHGLAAAPGVHVDGVSPLYETSPVGGPEQPDYLNAVVTGRTSLAPHQLLELAQSIERAWHRTRDVRWAARTLDVDIISVGDCVVTDEVLQLPHPRAAERAFVCVPLLAVDPLARIGAHSVAELVASMDCSGVRECLDMSLRIPETA